MVMNFSVSLSLFVFCWLSLAEFDFRANGVARYANNSNYRNDSLIRKESMSLVLWFVINVWIVCVSPAIISELKGIVQKSEIMKYVTHTL